MSVLGIDLSASSKKPSFHALLDGNSKLAHMGKFSAYDELLEFLEVHNPSLIAIDAPLSLPLGLDCLEESHPCTPALEHKGRASEQEMARMHIGCFFTTKRSIIKTLIYRGLEIYRDLMDKGYQVVEVYPYATKVILFGDKLPPKNSARGLVFLKDRLSGLIIDMGPYVDDLNHDGCDALLAAYTASLHEENKTDSLGVAEEGFVVVPRLLAKVQH